MEKTTMQAYRACEEELVVVVSKMEATKKIIDEAEAFIRFASCFGVTEEEAKSLKAHKVLKRQEANMRALKMRVCELLSFMMELETYEDFEGEGCIFNAAV